MPLGKLWPSHVLPRARSKVAVAYRYCLRRQQWLRNRVIFPVWRGLSKLRYGDARPVTAHGERIWVRTDDLRGFWVWRERGTQAHLVAVWKSLVDLAPELAIDVGANYGEFSVPAARRVPVLSIEANPAVCRQLERSLAQYPNASVVNAAASNSSGQGILRIPSGYTGGSSLSAEVVAGIGPLHVSSPGKIEELKSDVITIDQLLAGRYPRSVILKIDVEGFDWEAFEGAKETLRRAEWWRAIIEFNVETLKQRNLCVEDVWRRFSEWRGFALWGETVPRQAVQNIDSYLPAEPMARANLLLGEGRAN